MSEGMGNAVMFIGVSQDVPLSKLYHKVTFLIPDPYSVTLLEKAREKKQIERQLERYKLEQYRRSEL